MKKGTITIQFALIFTTILMVILTSIDISSIAYHYNRANRAVNMAAFSTLSQYDYKLKERYGVFGFDSGSLKDDLNYYIKENYRNSDSDSLEINILKSDSQFNLNQLENQIMAFVKYRIPASTISLFVKKLEFMKKGNEMGETSQEVVDLISDRGDNSLLQYYKDVEELKAMIAKNTEDNEYEALYTQLGGDKVSKPDLTHNSLEAQQDKIDELHENSKKKCLNGHKYIYDNYENNAAEKLPAIKFVNSNEYKTIFSCNIDREFNQFEKEIKALEELVTNAEKKLGIIQNKRNIIISNYTAMGNKVDSDANLSDTGKSDLKKPLKEVVENLEKEAKNDAKMTAQFAEIRKEYFAKYKARYHVVSVKRTTFMKKKIDQDKKELEERADELNKFVGKLKNKDSTKSRFDSIVEFINEKRNSWPKLSYIDSESTELLNQLEALVSSDDSDADEEDADEDENENDDPNKEFYELVEKIIDEKNGKKTLISDTKLASEDDDDLQNLGILVMLLAKRSDIDTNINKLTNASAVMSNYIASVNKHKSSPYLKEVIDRRYNAAPPNMETENYKSEAYKDKSSKTKFDLTFGESKGVSFKAIKDTVNGIKEWLNFGEKLKEQFDAINPNDLASKFSYGSQDNCGPEPLVNINVKELTSGKNPLSFDGLSGLTKNIYLNEYIIMSFSSIVTDKGRFDLKKDLNLRNQNLRFDVKSPVGDRTANFVAQIEYVVAGKSKDIDNLIHVCTKIFLIRMIPNTAYLVIKYSSEIWGIASLTGWFAPLTYVLLLGAWAAAESLYDLVQLIRGEGNAFLNLKPKDFALDGISGIKEFLKDLADGIATAAIEKVEDVGQEALDDTVGNFYKDIELQLPGKTKKNNYEDFDKDPSCITYEDYLRVFLLTVNRDKKLKRIVNLYKLDGYDLKGKGHNYVDIEAEFEVQLFFIPRVLNFIKSTGTSSTLNIDEKYKIKIKKQLAY